MKPYILKFPLRTIRLELQDKEQTNLEASGLTAYQNLHNELWNMKQQWLRYGDEIAKLEVIVTDLHLTYDKMEKEAMRYGKVGGFTDEEISHLLEETEEYTLKIDDLQCLITRYSTLANDYNEGRLTVQDLYTRTEEQHDIFYESFLHFDKYYFSPMIRNYDELQLHTLSLSKDYDEFRESLCAVVDLKEQFIDQWNDMGDRLDILDKKLKKLDKHMQCITHTWNALFSDASRAALN